MATGELKLEDALRQRRITLEGQPRLTAAVAKDTPRLDLFA